MVNYLVQSEIQETLHMQYAKTCEVLRKAPRKYFEKFWKLPKFLNKSWTELNWFIIRCQVHSKEIEITNSKMITDIKETAKRSSVMKFPSTLKYFLDVFQKYTIFYDVA